MAFRPLLSIKAEQRRYLYTLGENGATLEIHEFDDEVYIGSFRGELLHQVVGGKHSASGSQEIIVKEHHIVVRDGVLVYLYGVNAILFLATLLDGFSRKLSLFSYPLLNKIRLNENPC